MIRHRSERSAVMIASLSLVAGFFGAGSGSTSLVVDSGGGLEIVNVPFDAGGCSAGA